MRKFIFVFLLFCLISSVSVEIIAAAESSEPRMILYTWYRQIGEDDRIEIGSVDEAGVIRTFSGVYSEAGWPSETAEQLEYLSQTEKFNEEGTTSSDELFALKSLISAVENQEYIPTYTNILDGGIEESRAVRYSRDGEAETILLGMSGEVLFENTDPNAQALYKRLRSLFPGVPSDAYDPGLGPEGFQPVPLMEFAGLDVETVMNAEIAAALMDCEEGPIPVELTDAEKDALRDLIREGVVTGKADCVSSTGGGESYSFLDADGRLFGNVDFEDGLLVMNDGRYYVSQP